jgi:hypothetical protein
MAIEIPKVGPISSSVVGFAASLTADRAINPTTWINAGREALKTASGQRQFIQAIQDTEVAARILLDADTRGDPLVFGSFYGPVSYNQVIENYWGDKANQIAQSSKIEDMIARSTNTVPSTIRTNARSTISSAFNECISTDAAAVCLLRNRGKIGEIPQDTLSLLESRGFYNPNSPVNIFAEGNEADAIRWYRELQAEFFAQVMLAVFHRGNDERIRNDLPMIKQGVLLYQLGTDTLHEKNPHEPTFEGIRNSLKMPRFTFAVEEAHAIMHNTPRHQLLGWAGFLAVGALCRMSGKQAEWEK